MRDFQAPIYPTLLLLLSPLFFPFPIPKRALTFNTEVFQAFTAEALACDLTHSSFSCRARSFLALRAGAARQTTAPPSRLNGSLMTLHLVVKRCLQNLRLVITLPTTVDISPALLYAHAEELLYDKNGENISFTCVSQPFLLFINRGGTRNC